MITNTELENRGNLFPSKIISYTKKKNLIHFSTNNVVLQITVLQDHMLRFRYTTDLVFEKDFSYAIAKEHPIDYRQCQVQEKSNHYEITTKKIICRIDKENLKINLYDAIDKKIICQDELGFHWEDNYEHGGNVVKMSKVSKNGESYYGLGDKPEHSNLKGKRFQNWVTDSYAYGKDTDPIYKAIPFYTSLFQGKSYGIFFDNTFRSFFDFSHERKGVASFWAQGGEMNYYFIYGPKMLDVVESYTTLTGKPNELPPLWALGYHQCKWSYYPEKNVKEITQQFRDLKIPCDAIYLDIDYMDEFRCFTWNKEYFPNPKRMVSQLKKNGFKTVAIIDPGIKIDKDYRIFKEALKNDYFCKRADGPYVKGKVWPGECYFPDFTKKEVREWWAGLFKEIISDIGVMGIWNDMNEPAVMEVPNKTFPNDVRHDYDNHPCSHRKAHNIYGMQMVRATYHGLKRFAQPNRPFVITRSAYSGTQRYSSSWTGDNIASWEHLWIANVQAQRMAMSGFSFIGSDIGGFAEQPNAELYARWIQLGVFHPLCRTHSSGDHGDQEPWVFGDEITNIVRKFIELRYQLLPYLYTAFWQYIKKGTPILKSLTLYDQGDTQNLFRTDEFLYGNQILVCPILAPSVLGRRMYLPRGNWYHYWDNRLFKGGKEIWIDSSLDTVPMFIKAGAIIPRYPVQQYVGEKHIEQIDLDIYYLDGEETSEIYDDAHDGYDYTSGKYSLRKLILTGNQRTITIQQSKTGKFRTPYHTFKINLIGIPFKISKIEIDRVNVTKKHIEVFETETHSLTVKKDFSTLVIS